MTMKTKSAPLAMTMPSLEAGGFNLQLCAASFTNNKRTNVMHVELSHA